MKLFSCSVLFSLFLFVSGYLPRGFVKNENFDKSANEKCPDVCSIIRSYGYPCENHTVTTEDGYVLTLHRIPASPKCKSDKGEKSPCLLVHGLLNSGMDWVVNGKHNCLPCSLSDNCHDVWIANCRGNSLSRCHEDPKKDPGKPEFWKFCLHEMGIYDIPAFIDHVLDTTGHKDLHYIGFSQGTTIFFICTSQREEYNEKIKSAHCLAPIVYLNHMKSPVKYLAKFGDEIELMCDIVGVGELLPNKEIYYTLGSRMCADSAPLQQMCSNLLFLVCGSNSDELNTTMLEIILQCTPAGMGLKQFLHFLQMIGSGKFRQYDYGFLENLLCYHQLTPPEYDLSKCKCPVHLYCGYNDLLAAEEDVRKLQNELPNCSCYYIEHEKWNHLDFCYAIHAYLLCYNHVCNDIGRYY